MLYLPHYEIDLCVRSLLGVLPSLFLTFECNMVTQVQLGSSVWEGQCVSVSVMCLSSGALLVKCSGGINNDKLHCTISLLGMFCSD